MSTMQLPNALVRPRERTLEGVVEYLAEAERDLKKLMQKKNAPADEIERLQHRIKVLELKKAKFERMAAEKLHLNTSTPESYSFDPQPASPALSTAPTSAEELPGGPMRKESYDTLDRVNKEFDDQTSDLVLSDAFHLLGDNSVDMSRFLSHFNDDETAGGNYEQAAMIYRISGELEKYFGSGDELLAKQIILTAAKCKSLEEFELSLSEDIQGYDFPPDLVETIYDIISREESSDFSIDSYLNKLEVMSVVLESNITSITTTAHEGRAKLLESVVSAVSAWGAFLEALDVIIQRARAARIATAEVIKTRRRLGKHIAHVFSTISYTTASSVEAASWNAESAQANLDDAVKAVWRVTMSLVAAAKELLRAMREREQSHSARPGVVLEDGPITPGPAALSRNSKLEKFFGASPPKPTRVDKYAYVIAEAQFDRGLFFTMEGHVKGGTLVKLVERLTHHLYDDPAYVYAFLVTLPSFTDHQTVLKLLVERYKITPPAELNDEERQYYLEKKVLPVRAKVATVLMRWAQLWPEVFRGELKAQVRTLIDSTLMFDHAVECAALEGIMDGTVDPYKPVAADEKPSKPIVPKSLKGDITLLMLDPTEVARQLCLIDFAYYSAIRPREFVKLAWSEKDDPTRAPNIMQVIRRSTQFTSFVCHTILEQKDMRQRAETLRMWIQVLDKCRQLRNYNSLMSITGGLMSSAIHRLVHTWRLVPRRDVLIFEEIRELMSYRRNFGSYREAIRAATPPALPFLGIFLTDLTFIEDGNKDALSKSEFINFDKRAKAATVVQAVQSFQKVKYNFEPVREIEWFLLNISAYERNEEEFYQISVNVEKKESEVDLLTRALTESGFI